MDENTEIWRKYYEKALSRPHSKRTEFVVKLNESRLNVATDCGCGTGSDIEYLHEQGYQVHGFDINPDSIEICQNRFQSNSLVEISESSFEIFDYPKSGVVIANSSLFFAGDFMGLKDSWANNYRSSTTPLTESQVMGLFTNFEIIRFHERDETAETSLGKLKHWHTYSVVAVKRT
ncbi:class I SAM-dependent methyltransferase [Vibrio jasicida]|uniref:class I SAM-dependent methyltransferase n=1 Tax=Vibrio jasicida TaxID=766224 RepID=UPI000CE37629|nr:class I SAM-dependent methyltransferase [Vibrio jasicida]